MAKRIFVVGFNLPGDEFEYVPFNSDQSLPDADIVLHEPSLGGYRGFEEYNGRNLLTQDGSVRIVENIRQRPRKRASSRSPMSRSTSPSGGREVYSRPRSLA